MSRNIFGWDLPPGVTQRQIDEQCGGDDPPCQETPKVDDYDVCVWCGADPGQPCGWDR
jgi:hypothetical protein